MKLEVVEPRWRSCIVAAPGPSLFAARERPIIAVQNAWEMIPWADVMYGCDPHWWSWWAENGGTAFRGEKWSTHDIDESCVNDKTEAHERWGVRCVRGREEKCRFSRDPGVINYGDNSGFQAVNLAILFGCTHITLIGFDMREVDGRTHFFGHHPPGLNTPNFKNFIKFFRKASEALEDDVRIVNATPGSALEGFPMMSFEDAMQERYVHDYAEAGYEDGNGLSREGTLPSSRPAQSGASGTRDEGGTRGEDSAQDDEEEACAR